MPYREEMLTVLGNYKCGQLRNYWVTEDRIVMRLMLFDPGRVNSSFIAKCLKVLGTFLTVNCSHS